MGLMRLILACGVLQAHTGAKIFPMIEGGFAVKIFFIISGYFMMMVWSEKYSASATQPARTFYRNRLIRIYPMFWLATGLVVAFSFLGGDRWLWFESAFRQANFLSKVFVVLSQITIVGQDVFWFLNFQNGSFQIPTFEEMKTLNYGSGLAFSLIPVAFSLAIEVWFYLCVPRLAVLANKKVFSWFVLTLSWTVYFGLQSFGFARIVTYHFPITNFCLFFLGMMSYAHLERSQLYKFVYKIPGGLIVGFLTFFVLYYLRLTGSEVPAFIVFAFFIPAAFRAAKSWAWDRWLGDLSYPIFLFHFMILAALRGLGIVEFNQLAIVGVVVSIAVSIPLAHVFQTQVERWFKKQVTVRTGSSTPPLSVPQVVTADL